MQIEIISVGKIKEKHYRAAVDEYVKRLSRYCKLRQTEVADERAPQNLSAAEAEIVKRREAERILKKIGADDYVISLEIEGQALTSEKFAQKMNALAISGSSKISFVIGGSLGLAGSVKARSDYALSFSNMTFPHQLMKVVLLEQIYRSFKINKGEPYHK